MTYLTLLMLIEMQRLKFSARVCMVQGVGKFASSWYFRLVGVGGKEQVTI